MKTKTKKKNPHAVALGRLGGQQTSVRKAAAARKNGVLGKKFGKLGGRPRKVQL